MNAQTKSKEYRAPEKNSVQTRAQRILKGTASFEDRFIPDHAELVKVIEILHAGNCAIAFVTGVWDLFHIGHAEYLRVGKERAIKECEGFDQVILVVGVDTDKLTKERKGPTRPIVPEDERVRVLGHLRAVDIITLQYEADQLFNIVHHDARIISESTKDLPQLENIQSRCKHLVNLPPQAETSTTARIRRLALDGSLETLAKLKVRLDSVMKDSVDRILAAFKEITDEIGG